MSNQPRAQALSEGGVIVVGGIDYATRYAINVLKGRGALTEERDADGMSSFRVDESARSSEDEAADFKELVEGVLGSHDIPFHKMRGSGLEQYSTPSEPGATRIVAGARKAKPDRSSAVERVRKMQARLRADRSNLPHGL